MAQKESSEENPQITAAQKVIYGKELLEMMSHKQIGEYVEGTQTYNTKPAILSAVGTISSVPIAQRAKPQMKPAVIQSGFKSRSKKQHYDGESIEHVLSDHSLIFLTRSFMRYHKNMMIGSFAIGLWMYKKYEE